MTWTVPQLLKALGYEQNNRASWEIGAAIREMWIEETGEPPVKELRTKTNGGGSHCFAIYPDDWEFGRRAVAALAKSVSAETARQGDLF